MCQAVNLNAWATSAESLIASNLGMVICCTRIDEAWGRNYSNQSNQNLAGSFVVGNLQRDKIFIEASVVKF